LRSGVLGLFNQTVRKSQLIAVSENDIVLRTEVAHPHTYTRLRSGVLGLFNQTVRKSQLIAVSENDIVLRTEVAHLHTYTRLRSGVFGIKQAQVYALQDGESDTTGKSSRNSYINLC
jgi:hypothetical protein